jgi:hypothetical protein
MEIKPNYQAPQVGAAQAGRPAPRPVPDESGQVDFSDSSRLEQQLQNLPDVRPEAVQRGRELVADKQYPPQEGIRKISQLLAMNFADSL